MKQVPRIMLLFAAASLFSLTTAYVAGYFLAGDEIPGKGRLCRTYRNRWLASLYRPAAKVESVATNQDVRAVYWPSP